VFLHTLYVYFVSPYFYDDAFMHHTMHVLDAPVDVDLQRRLSQAFPNETSIQCNEYKIRTTTNVAIRCYLWTDWPIGWHT